ncbi:unnamed protein product [Adineta steineri]|uniref:NHL repeat containing protein n=2 Tax=Adineta steineri TaxID=433720 RepID=A0A814WLS2_9BILA|nr:unnamed protein product [Adineta steineri]CAF3632423.1 unnamed protein product [Adineta steineri]
MNQTVAYNQPNLCANASWNATAITFATSTIVGGTPYGIFVDINNTVYVADRQDGRVIVWFGGSTVISRNLTGTLSSPYGIFVTSNGDIYVDNGASNYRVDKWQLNSTNSTPAMYTCAQCDDLHIDINNTLYCTWSANHQILAQSLSNRLTVWRTIAGIAGSAGSASNQLYSPRGIFVDGNLNIYVADSTNNRIQFFLYGQLTATTIVGSSVAGSMTLSTPTDVLLDGNGYLFIMDSENQRIIGSGPYGYRCVAGCTQAAGSASNQMDSPQAFAFDSYGNIFVTDRDNNRVQIFLLAANSCSTTTTAAPITATLSTNIIQATTPSISSSYSNALSFNQPQFGAYAMWDGNGLTFATSGTVGADPYGFFINTNNTVFVADRADNRINIWLEGSTNPTSNITTGIGYAYGIFGSSKGDLYVDNGYLYQRVDKWAVNATTSTYAMYSKYICYDLFIDINNNLYCALFDYHQIVMTSLNTNSSMWIIAAGTSCAGSTSNTLYNPRGVFVDTNLNIYVADSVNNRVQLFLSGQATATTVVGSAAIGTFSLYYPTDVMLDANGYIFVVDSYNHRIIGSGPYGFRCILACSGAAGSSSSQLYYPSSLSFDSHGNIFVLDRTNYRLQKFFSMPNTTYPFSFNQPSFCPSSTWYTNAITFANSSTIGTTPYGIFVNLNNTVYVASQSLNQIQIWLQGSIVPNQILSGGLSSPLSLFTTLSGDIYVDNGVSYSRVDKWPANSNSSVVAMQITEECYSMFVDMSNTLYCAMTFSHRIAKKYLNDNGTTLVSAAGTGTAGGAVDQLYYPAGIHVDKKFNLYVGDCGNNRVQMFGFGQLSATTVAGSGASWTITLSCPNAVTLDANGYLFITDNYNSRVIGSGPFGFRCLFGCTGAGSSASQLNAPRTFSFDSYGNLFVADENNNRIQKFILASNSCSISYSQPTFCSDALWYSNASTFASSTTIGSSPYGIFIDGINTVYVASLFNNIILTWPQWSTTPTGNMSINLNRPYSLFVSIAGDVYVDNGYSNGRVDKFTYNSSNVITVMNVSGSCYGLFIDISNNLYCSLKNLHQVDKLPLNSGTTIPTIAAGTGTAGSLSNMLNSPQGIYVDNNLTLYIADCGNNRIQSVQTGQLNGMTIAGNGSSANIILNCPTGIVLDASGYLFIVDSYNHRIVGSNSNGFQCLVGCSGSGTTSSQLYFPQSMAFDSYGNIYVTDRNNSRVQQFTLQSNCHY